MDTLAVRTALQLLELASKHEAGQAWASAFADVTHAVNQAATADPKLTPKGLFNSPTVRKQLVEPFVQAGVSTIDAVRQAWSGQIGDAYPAELNKILKNVRANTSSAPARFRTAVVHGAPDEMALRLKALSKNLNLRAQYAVEYATKRANTLHAIQTPGATTKTWTNVDPKCVLCQALSGVTIGVNDVFDSSAGGSKLKPFGSLVGPPGHVNCRCWLVTA